MVEKCRNFPKTVANEKALTFPSPAKLNLFLYITGKRKDGYHELQTLFQFLDYGDELTIEPTTDGNILLTPDITDLPLEQNLIYRAARLLQQHCHIPFGAKIHLNKHLPMGGGVGGGSSNAATTLVALNLLWQCDLSLDQLVKLGLTLGADVPIFVKGEAAFAQGVGDIFTPCNAIEKWYLVLKPNISVSTQAVFSHPDLPRTTPKRTLEQCLNIPYENDCEKVVKKHYREVEETLSWLLKYAPARLTGTGACVFAEFDNQIDAETVFSHKPQWIDGFVAKGQNRSPLHQFIHQLTNNASCSFSLNSRG